LIFTGKRIFADDALKIGLVNAVVPADVLMDEAVKMAESILTSAPIAVKYAKKCINDNYVLSTTDAISLENNYFSKCFATEDQKEGMTAFLEKKKADFKNK